ncbi:MAG: hypothetical protein WB586_28600 [Chthoniobacterales bacterium]
MTKSNSRKHDLDLQNELARLRAEASVHDACVVIYDALPNLPSQKLRVAFTAILGDLQVAERKLHDLKVVAP